MNINDFNFKLPKSYISQSPKNIRSSSKLLVINRNDKKLIDEKFDNIDKYVSSNDLIIINDTKVIPARVYGHRKNTKGKVEVFIERIIGIKTILCQIKSTRKLKKNDIIVIGSNIEIRIEKNKDDLVTIEILNSTAQELLANYGSIPLPPYISRAPNANDKEFYQTIFAKNNGSVASPTAGLHFDDRVLKKLSRKKVMISSLTLHIGMGTFSPIKTQDVNNHNMHSEIYYLPQKTINNIKRCKDNNGKIIAVGITVARALESFYSGEKKGDTFYETNIFIKPGYNFKVVDHLVTNFHLPKSSLLVMICAFYNKEKILEAYEFAKKKAINSLVTEIPH